LSHALKTLQPDDRATTCLQVVALPGAAFASATRMREQRTTVMWMMAVGLAFAFTSWMPAHDALLYNHSSSVPAGLYQRSNDAIELGALVTVRAVEVAPFYAADRDFTDAGDRFIKRIAAVSGDEVCAAGGLVTINGGVAAERQTHDGAGRALPTWTGCRVLGAEEVLLLGDTMDSFDGRYWGPVSTRLIEGVWQPMVRQSD
jgi:conjugative transfer signal peptidase TraF